MDVVKISDRQVKERAIDVLRKGGLVVVPSDTVYGLSVDATNAKAVQKLIAFKSRTPGKAISVFVGSLERGAEYVEMTDQQEALLKTMLPGSYTIVLPSKGMIDPGIVAENGTLGIRVPDYPFINELVEKFGGPITATSANQAGRSPQYSVDALLRATPAGKKELIDLIIDAGKLPRNKPSTVVDFTRENFEVLRQGDLAVPNAAARVMRPGSEDETQEIAQRLLSENLMSLREKPLVFLLYGDLGAGKTVFVKGIGKALGINDIVSPTFVISFEYAVQHEVVKNLYHFDLYRVQEAVEYEHLGIDDMLVPGNVIAIEWSEKSGVFVDKLKKKAKIVQVLISHQPDAKRKLEIY